LPMLLSSLRRNRQVAPARSRTGSRPRPSCRPRLEALEERLAPATCIWDGGSLVNSNWSTAANWVGDVAPVPCLANLAFPAAPARKASTNDFVGAAFLGLAFTGSGYTLGGNTMTLGGNVTAGPGTFNNFLTLDLTLDGNRTFRPEAGSVLTVNGVIGDNGGAW